MKKTTLLSLLLIIAFFLPWVDFNIISFNGYQLPKAAHQLGSIGGSSALLLLVYLVYLMPIFSLLSIANEFKLINLPFAIKKIDFSLAVVICFYIAYSALERSSNFLSFLGLGFYLTALVSIIGLLIKTDTEIKFFPNQSNTSTTAHEDLFKQLQKLKELREKELISEEEYNEKKQSILGKM